MSRFYTAVYPYGNSILCREIVDGKHRQSKIPFQPSLFVRDHNPHQQDGSPPETCFYSMKQEPLREVKFGSIREAKDFLSRYEGVSNHDIYGMTKWAYQYIVNQYGGPVDFDLSQLGIWTVDIETKVGDAFPNPATAPEEILLITMLNNVTKEYYTWGRLAFDVEEAASLEIPEFDIKEKNLNYRHFPAESDMLIDFINWWKNTNIDCLTDWNGEGFDVPYLVNRIMRVLGEAAVLSLSPFGIVNDREIQITKDRTAITYDIEGISHLDYLALYKKFTFNPRESYGLGFIGQEELGITKLDMGCSFRDSYRPENWHRFVCYNIRDVEIVDKLEDKLSLIQLAYTVAYDAHCLPTDVFGAVKTWDCLMYSSLFADGIVVPQKKDVVGWQIEGAYVKEPKPGRYKNIASIDAESLYPTIMRQYNMSPETMLDDPMHPVTVDGLIAQEYDLSFLKTRNIGMTANGQFFRNDIPGLFPKIVEKQFGDRKRYKALMKKSESMMEQIKKEQASRGSVPDLAGLSDAELKALYAKTNKEIATYNNFQMAKKILMNSLYGACGNKGFRFYDPRFAEGITLTGQYFIKMVGNAIDAYLGKLTGIPMEYTFYQDTDSCYFTLDNIAQKFIIPKCTDENGIIDINKVVDALIRVVDEKITPVVNTACNGIADYTNSIAQLMNFKREAIADTGVWVAKKRYALNVLDNENVRYATPKVKIMGLEIVRSSTPAPCRSILKESVTMVLRGTEAELQDYIAQQRKKFMLLQPHEIAFPRGVSRLAHYADPNHIFAKGCPIQVRAALLHNHLVEKFGISGEVDLIREGDKMKFVHLRMPNPIGQDVIAFSEKLPQEFGLQKFVDHATMWQKAVLGPLENIIQPIGWTYETKASFDFLFS